MKRISFFRNILIPATVILMISCSGAGSEKYGATEITKWPGDKSGAVSLTFDDASINQFRVAMPIMDSLGFPGTFFIITGEIPGAVYKPGFIGRPQEEIIKETASVPTGRDNLFERASLIAYAPYQGLRNIFTQAGEEYESGRIDDACRLIDEAFRDLRNNKFKPRKIRDNSEYKGITWDEIKTFAGKGHEFASHTITHPRLAILDSVNIVYELEGSRKEILEKMGEKFTFSAECPYGTEDERVMRFAHRYYPVLRNRMPEPFLEELNRGSRKSPVMPERKYVQWQRGALTSTPMEMMKSWIDTCNANENIWLVLVFHGVDGIGWEALKGDDLRTYYNYIKSKENRLWIATFGNVAKYIRERMYSKIETTGKKNALNITITNNLGKGYDFPLTVRTYIPKSQRTISLRQGVKDLDFTTGRDDRGEYILYSAFPNREAIELSFK